ncbi:MAG: class I SAM-dependent methyltransferase [Thermoproteota archaeon]
MGFEYQREMMKFYNAIFREFDRTRVSPDPILKILTARSFTEGSRIILDNGCGNCRNLKLFSGETILIAGDIARNMLKQCKKNRPGLNIHYVQYALTHLPFRNNVFDGVFCIATIHHLKKSDVLAAIVEMSNVLKSRGWLLISSWSTKILRSKRFLKKIERLNEDYFLIKWGVYKRFYFLMDARTLREICKKAGLRNITALEYGMNSYILVEGGKERRLKGF